MVKVSIGSLSKAALKKLKDGLPVRVKQGDSVEVELDVGKHLSDLEGFTTPMRWMSALA